MDVVTRDVFLVPTKSRVRSYLSAEAQAYRYGRQARELLFAEGTQEDVDEKLHVHLEAWHSFMRQLLTLDWSETLLQRVSDGYRDGVDDVDRDNFGFN